MVFLSIALSYQQIVHPKAGTVSSAPWCPFYLVANTWSQVSMGDSLPAFLSQTSTDDVNYKP